MGSWKEQESKEAAENEKDAQGVANFEWKGGVRRRRGKQRYRRERVDRRRIENGLCIWRSLAFLVSDFVSTSGVELRGLCWLGEMTREPETFPLSFPFSLILFLLSPPAPLVTLLQPSHPMPSVPMRFNATLIWCPTADLLRMETNETSCRSTCTIRADRFLVLRQFEVQWFTI